MHVQLIEYTPNPEKVVAAAARLCYSPLSANEIMDGLNEQMVESFLQKLTDMGHSSPLEHASFTFAIEGVSRALSHQLVRHRIGVSFSQKSQRYVKEKQFEYIVPPSIAKKELLKEKYEAQMAQIQALYNEFLQAGLPAEDARYLLPNAAETKLVVTMNARSLHHFFRLRCCNRAQWEIRAMAKQMLVEVRKVAPTLFAKAGPSCETEGICYEGKMCCGKAKTLAQIMEKQ